ncbi:MAG: hypothetical protein GDA49_04445 [Rhodospirillales bacterium]|nr:hypothetical protein [Rhodospirillales bacterium]
MLETAGYTMIESVSMVFQIIDEHPESGLARLLDRRTVRSTTSRVSSLLPKSTAS